jgi:L-serine dehydratase
VRIGYVAGKLLAEPVAKAEILLYGSFLATGKGHGTRQALCAGLLGMLPDDERVPESLKLAEEAGVEIVFGKADLRDGHPNSAQLYLTGSRGRKMEIVGESIGGSRINIASIDGMSANFSGEYPTLIVNNSDRPGQVAEVTRMLEQCAVNIATMQLNRAGRGDDAVMVIECDQEVPGEACERLKRIAGIRKVTYYSPNTTAQKLTDIE